MLAVLAYTITVPNEEKVCFGQELISTSSMQITVFVVSGGDLQISAKLTDPVHREIKTIHKESMFTFIENYAQEGTYQFCFWNYDLQPRQVSFFIVIQEPIQKVELDSVDQKLLTSQERMLKVQQFQRQQQQMDNRLIFILQTVKSSLSYNAFMKIVVIIGCGGFQIYSFKRYFTKKRTAV
ncbi:EMP24/GP25L/P24 family/GOLD family protein [Spironucleus salmonicida]|uniref:EMP24/GP25L/P24 family/GOLD family protein n=1 Tax=Spironucleus salmonicida TaxID=348837 RepID=V6LQC8_9EUKA|nr:EMP24/GP25L/P24 family/GOLD family protein [Spironucleus salmonicida]|eukprot:EST46453.1 EMP24/GP25L/P24 family/GOLD family protein [Spironucleus salmonicida]